jgi:hypothetical protein
VPDASLGASPLTDQQRFAGVPAAMAILGNAAGMARRRLRLLIALVTVVAAVAVAVVVVVARSSESSTFAVIGDVPYSPAQQALLPSWVDKINADPDVALVAHLGDVRSGAPCNDEYFASIRRQFDRFSDPFVYTPGDNDWTDCHKPTGGGYDPLERLGALRRLFFAKPGQTLGQHPIRVQSQDGDGYPENVSFTRGHVAFGAVHIVGGDNGLAHWTGKNTNTPAQSAEVLGRTAAAIGLIKDTFARAKGDGDKAVVLLTQAEMFPTDPAPDFEFYYGFQPIVATIARQARDFNGPVYLFNGDSHIYNVDRPLAVGAPMLAFYGIDQPVDNLTRITVQGSTKADEYLKVTIGPRQAEVLSWQRVPFKD